MPRKSQSLLNKFLKMIPIDTITKKIKFFMRGNNMNKVLLLVAILLVLYFVYNKYLVKEGFEVEPAKVEEEIGEGKNLLMFYADWCGHCKKLKPVWDELAEEINGDETNGCKMMKINCSTPDEEPSQKEIMQKYQVSGYPTIKLVENGNVTDFEGERSKEGIMHFLGLGEKESKDTELK